MNRFLFAFLLVLALFAACRKEFDLNSSQQLGPIPTVNVEASLTGHVVDAAGNPIAGALVEVAGLTLTTNDQGLFFVHKKLLDRNGAYVKVTKNGYFNAVKFAFPRLGTSAYMEVKMIEKAFYTVFEASAGSTFPGGNGSTITIPADAIADANGQPYAGSVKAFSVWLSPSDDNTYNLMPGDLRAVDAAGYAQMLKSFGMIGVELESPSGEKLNLDLGKKASISMNVPADVLANAPATIPLWHFDEPSGYWKEEGSATLAGNNYEYEVGHFSFWNCDTPEIYILLSGSVSDTNNNPLSNIRITVTSQNFGTGDAYTDSEGKFGGAVPKNALLTIKAYSSCGDVLYEQNIGPFSENATLGKILIAPPSATTITGTLLDCDLNALPDGLAIIERNGTILATLPTDVNGNFAATVLDCVGNLNYKVTGFDYTHLLQSAPLNFTPLNNNASLGSIQVCSSLDEFISVTIDGHTQILSPYLAFDTDGYIAGQNATDSSFINLRFQYFTSVSYALVTSLYGRQVEASGTTTYGCENPCSTCVCKNSNPLTFINYPAASGEYAIGATDGTIVKNGSTTLVPFSVSFRIKKY